MSLPFMPATYESGKWESFTIKVPSPDGNIFLTICEDETGQPVSVQIMIGKAGTAIMAWAYATARLITTMLEQKVPLSKIIEETSGITTHQIKRYGDGIIIRSGPEGISHALLKYMWQKPNGNGVVKK